LDILSPTLPNRIWAIFPPTFCPRTFDDQITPQFDQ
jgi:hypothetical protein